MKVAIIGAGFAGLAAAYYLAKAGQKVTVLEKLSEPGGLATGFKESDWNWPLEQHYHHFFQSDLAIQELAGEIGHPITFYSPVTSTFYKSHIYRLDSPLTVLKFSPLPMLDRIRMGGALAFLKINPWWQPLEYITAKNFILTTMGEKAWRVVWEPLFIGKFGAEHTPTISASWFWARINPRSPKLGYPEGGFLGLARAIQKAAEKLGAKFDYNTSVDSVQSLLKKYDKVICTLPTGQLEKISGLTYQRNFGLGAVNVVLALKQSFLPNNIYWLNVNDRKFPFLAVVEHTNLLNKKHYNNDHLVYVGNYLPSSHKFFSLSEKQLIKLFSPYLKKLNPKFNKNWIRAAWVFKAPYAQPVVTTRYSKHIPPMVTPIPNLYLANIQQVYPYDRGTNFAVILGRRASDLCLIK